MFRNSSSSHLCSLPDPVSPSVPPVSPQCPPPVSLPGTIRPPRNGPGSPGAGAHKRRERMSLAQQTSTRSKAQGPQSVRIDYDPLICSAVDHEQPDLASFPCCISFFFIVGMSERNRRPPVIQSRRDRVQRKLIQPAHNVWNSWGPQITKPNKHKQKTTHMQSKNPSRLSCCQTGSHSLGTDTADRLTLPVVQNPIRFPIKKYINVKSC